MAVVSLSLFFFPLYLDHNLAGSWPIVMIKIWTKAVKRGGEGRGKCMMFLLIYYLLLSGYHTIKHLLSSITQGTILSLFKDYFFKKKLRFTLCNLYLKKTDDLHLLCDSMFTIFEVNISLNICISRNYFI